MFSNLDGVQVRKQPTLKSCAFQLRWGPGSKTTHPMGRKTTCSSLALLFWLASKVHSSLSAIEQRLAQNGEFYLWFKSSMTMGCGEATQIRKCKMWWPRLGHPRKEFSACTDSSVCRASVCTASVCRASVWRAQIKKTELPFAELQFADVG